MRSTALCLTLVLGGCGYSIGYPSAAPGIRTVAVRVVDNATFRQRIERDLTRSIARQMDELTSYRHASSSSADAILEVEISAIRNATIVVGAPTPVREGSLDAIARIRLVERRTGAVLVETVQRDIAEYRSLIGEDGTTAQAELVSDLGRLILLALEPEF